MLSVPPNSKSFAGICIAILALSACGKQEVFDECDAKILAYDGVRSLNGIESVSLQESVRRGWVADVGKKCGESYSSGGNRSRCNDEAMKLFREAEAKGIATGSREKFEQYEAEAGKECSSKMAAYNEEQKKYG